MIFKHTVSHRKEKQLTNEKIGTSTLPVFPFKGVVQVPCT